jgi:hypothetical protein
MAQHDYNIADQNGVSFLSDINAALAAIATQNAGASAPTTTFAYMPWADTTLGLLKIRDGANASWIVVGPLTDLGIQSGVQKSAVTAVGADTYTANLTPALAAYQTNSYVLIKFTTANSGAAATLSLNGLVAKSIIKKGGVALGLGDIPSNFVGLLFYDGTNFNLMNPVPGNGTTLNSYKEGTATNAAATGAINLDCSKANNFDLTLTGNLTPSFTNVPADTGVAFSITLKITQDATGSRTITWPAAVKWPSGVAPTLTTTAAKTDFIGLTTYNNGTTWYGFAGQKSF